MPLQGGTLPVEFCQFVGKQICQLLANPPIPRDIIFLFLCAEQTHTAITSRKRICQHFSDLRIPSLTTDVVVFRASLLREPREQGDLFRRQKIISRRRGDFSNNPLFFYRAAVQNAVTMLRNKTPVPLDRQPPAITRRCLCFLTGTTLVRRFGRCP